ncbi:hypothetical protein AAU61_01910 [Desulfocarbo indianensis]|nr:hypothetical protein AAU61_01910 [Desulfocarbo indianensis]
MLERTFLHIPGVGPKRERAIWRAGVTHWRDFLERGEELLPRQVFNLGRPVVEASLAALERPGGLAELAALLPASEHWRFYPAYERVVYLDIETGGDPGEWGGVTVVGLFDGQKVEQYVAGRNLHELDHAMRGRDIVCTFAGGSFDLPVLRGVFANLYLPPAHIDLRWALKRLGYTGGLKRIERQLEIARPESVRELSGQDAVTLWRDHLAGDGGALDILLEYNAYDVINLRPLLELAAGRLRERELGRLGLASRGASC